MPDHSGIATYLVCLNNLYWYLGRKRKNYLNFDGIYASE